jgi:uridine kinase
VSESNSLPYSPVIIGVAGCSGSGKTTLVQQLARSLNGAHFHLDNYYRDLRHLSHKERCCQDFDHPDSLELELLEEHISQLSRGYSIRRPIYDFASHSRMGERTELVEAIRFLLIDGIFALYYECLRPFYNLKIYVDTPDSICYERRLTRDINDRGRTPESVAEQYAATVRPMAEKFVRPSAIHADIVVKGTSPLNYSVEQVLTVLKSKGLLQFGQHYSYLQSE